MTKTHSKVRDAKIGQFRTIKVAPKKGNISRVSIKKAVKIVSSSHKKG